MSKTQKFTIRTNYNGTTNLSKLLLLENQATQITSGLGPVSENILDYFSK